MSRDWELYIEDILEACRKIVLYTEGMSFEQFTADAGVASYGQALGKVSEDPDITRIGYEEGVIS